MSIRRISRKALEDWKSSLSLALPGLSAPVALKGVSTCLPESWHAAACVLHVRPCHESSLRGGVCREDCVRLLTRCAKPPLPATPQALCALLSPPQGEPCIGEQGELMREADINHFSLFVFNP